MLNSIRKAADNVIFKFVLGFMVIAFIIWGIGDVLRGRNNFDLVTFKTAEAISEAEFVKAKQEEITRLQSMSGTHLSEEDIKRYGINNIVLDRLVSNRLLKQFVKQYDLDFSEQTLADFIKKLPNFQDDKGRFDLRIFEAAFKHSGLSENEYSAKIKESLTQNLLLDLFVASSYIPKALVQNIADYMAEERIIDVVSISLNSTKYAQASSPTKEQLENFYKENIDLFTLAEKRKLNYVVISEETVRKSITVTQEEMQQFFEDNKEEFGENASFAKLKKQVEAALIQRKAEALLIELAKNLEDEVAGGTSLKEIAEKFELKLVAVPACTADSLVANKVIGALVDTIFGMQDGELSYPLELPEPRTMALVEVQSITPAVVQDLPSVKEDVSKAWLANSLKSLNMKILQDFASNVSPQDFKAEANKLGLTLSSDVALKRSELASGRQWPPEMLIQIFNAKPGVILPLYASETQAFVTLLKKANLNSVESKRILKESGENIAGKVKQSLVQETLNHLRNKEDVKISQKDPVLE